MDSKIEPETSDLTLTDVFHDALELEFVPIPTKDETFKNPNMDIAQLKFLLTLPEYKDNKDKRKKLMEYIEENDMAPFYEALCKELSWKLNIKFHKDLVDKNIKAIETFDSEIDYAMKNLGEVDVKVAYLNKALYLSQIGDKDETIKTLNLAYDKTVALGCKLDNVFHCARLGLFFRDLQLINASLVRSEELLEQGADWHYRNCFKIYKGLYSIAVRDFATACAVFSSSTSTFVCTELITFDKFIKYTVLLSILTLKRHDFKKKIIDCPDVQEALNYNQILKLYAMALYDCEYDTFFKKLAEVEKIMKEDMLLNSHYQYYVREMKIKAYNQILSTYISVSLSYMSEQFGVSEDYIEEDLSKFIAAKRLNYKIDKISGKILNMKQNFKQDSFENVLKHGDVLLTRIQKLGRVINV